MVLTWDDAAGYLLPSSPNHRPFTACSDDDDFSVEGKWNIVKETTNVYSGTSATGTPVYTYTETQDLGWIQFNSDGTGIDSEDYTFTWTLKGDKLAINQDGEEVTLTLTTKDGGKMVGYFQETFTEDEGDMTVKVIIEFAKV
ncbi:MAG TPA: lipocalin family protein [Tenuifilaceae bacterium]|nr:lipocalin family protein [Tenuifilaceae bacterium]HPW26631.1 lipocalin family protein [Tenuifilaceae bacterium]